MGFIPSARGKISLLGYSVKDALKNNLIAYVPQSEEVDWDFPVLVKDVVLMGRYGKMGLMRRARAEDLAIVHKSLERVGMLDFEDRQIGELSGGQRKRVFLARALAQEGKVILLDEPFTSLDAHMARDLREEVVSLLRQTETTAIIVTHDQEEALSVCDVVSVLENGSVIQSATPQEIYLNPVSQTVANSVGDPNILKGFSVDGRVETSLGTFVTAYNGALDVSIRPECIELLLDSEGSYVVKECTFYGHDQVISFQNSKGEVFRARSLPNTIYEAGDKVNINISEVTTFPSN